MAFLLSLIFALVSAAAPWLLSRVKNTPIVVALVLGIVLIALTLVFNINLYPWSNAITLVVALTAGVLLARNRPAAVKPLLIFLLILSALDIIENALPGPSSSSPAGVPSAAHLAGNILLLLPWGRFNLGIFDVLIIALLSEHGRRRGDAFPLTLLPGALGMTLAFAFLWLIYRGSLPLIPFITAGWLCTLALTSARRQTRIAPGHSSDIRE